MILVLRLLEGPTVLLGSPKASGTGVNLAATNTLHHLESRWLGSMSAGARYGGIQLMRNKQMTEYIG